MPQISKRILQKEIKQDVLDSFSYILKDLKTKKEIDLFLDSALTGTERLMISKRVVTAFLLKHGIEDTKISRVLKITPATIRRLKIWIELKKDGYELVFKKLKKRSMENMGKQLLYKVLDYAIKAAFGRIPKLF